MELKKEIWSYFKPMQKIYLATSVSSQPYVRPVILIYNSDRFWVATGTEDKKTGQIKSNNKMEFCLSITDGKSSGYIRGSGIAEIVDNDSEREMIFNEAKFIHNYWSSHSNPGFTLLHLNLSEIEFMRPGKNLTDTIKLK